jgi:predicted MPP superfamily phosphohydrolase
MVSIANRKNKWDPPSIIESLLESPLTFLVSIIHHLLLYLRGAPYKVPTHKPPIKVVCISDTHGHSPSIPPGDLLIHAGDLTNSGRREDIQQAVNWLSAQPHRYKICIAGNHDNFLDPHSEREQDVAERKAKRRIDWKDVVYLNNTMTLLKFKGGRTLEVYGAPDIPYISEKGHA